MIAPIMAAVADITTDENRGKGLSRLGAAMSLGFVIGPGIGGFLTEYGLRVPFYAAAAVVAGLNNAYMGLGNIMGPAMAGVLFDMNIDLPYMLGALIILISLLLSVYWGCNPGVQLKLGSKTALEE